jgi:hypothetical protein
MKTQNYLFGFIVCSFLVSTSHASAQTKPENPACSNQNPESALFSNIDLPANGRPAPGKHFNFTGTAKTLVDTNTVSSALVWRPDLCAPILYGIEQKFVLTTDITVSQQTLIGVDWKNISVTVVQQDSKIGLMTSFTTSF